MNTDQNPNGNGSSPLSPAPCSASWKEERSFWFKKADQAFIRYRDAMERGDEEAAQIAVDQYNLCHRRYYAVVVPPEVLEEMKQRRDAEKRAALAEA
jgi:hypothetical protein